MIYTLNAKGKLLSLEKPLVMGILNVTPDSFFDGGVHLGEKALISHVGSMLDQGADIIDVGGQSTRPGSTPVDAKEEAERVIPVIERIHHQFPEAILSIDTFYASVAEKALNGGASIVNDVSAGKIDPDMISMVGLHGNVPYICMHMKGTPQTMQDNPIYENVVNEVIDFFKERIDTCKAAGIKDIVLDPGFGFGKSVEHNYTLLRYLSSFQILSLPLLAGLSRKGMIWKTLGVDVKQALNGTTVLNTLALSQGASILRVHDVREAKEAILLHEMYKKSAPRGA